jgi:ribosomal protein L20
MCQQKYAAYKSEDSCGDVKTNENFKDIRCSTIWRDFSAMEYDELAELYGDVKKRLNRVSACQNDMRLFWEDCVHFSCRDKPHADVRNDLQGELTICTELKFGLRERLREIKRNKEEEKRVTEEQSRTTEKKAAELKQLNESLTRELEKVTGLLLEMKFDDDSDSDDPAPQLSVHLREDSKPGRKQKARKRAPKDRKGEGKGKGKDMTQSLEEDVEAIVTEFQQRLAERRKRELSRRKSAVDRIHAAQSYPDLALKWSSFIDIFLESAKIQVDRYTLEGSHDNNILSFLLNEEHRVPIEFLEQLADLMDSLKPA